MSVEEKEELEKLKEECMKRRDAVYEKYKNVPIPKGLDGDPRDKELRVITIWVDGELKKLRKKYGK